MDNIHSSGLEANGHLVPLDDLSGARIHAAMTLLRLIRANESRSYAVRRGSPFAIATIDLYRARSIDIRCHVRHGDPTAYIEIVAPSAASRRRPR